jgi:hypothetical protein
VFFGELLEVLVCAIDVGRLSISIIFLTSLYHICKWLYQKCDLI